MKIFEDLKWRGLIKDISNEEEIRKLLNEKSVTFYWGTDPSGDSLHIGHLSSVFLAKRLKDAGHHPILLVGGATGLIGDPRPSVERSMIDIEALNKNYEALHKQITDLFGFDMVNNYDWSKEINFIEFLRDYGKYFNVNYMLDKDIIRRRLETGITYCEFSYMIMQALDFAHLYETRNCILQVAGSDQWGNITAGMDLIKKKLNKEAYCFTMPLILDKEGNKFGKSEGNALWIDKNKTSSYEIYQYLINTDDSLIEHYLKVFTFLSKEELEQIFEDMKKEPEKRLGQQILVKELITFLRGEEAYLNALKISEILFSGEVNQLSKEEINIAFKNMPFYELKEEVNIIDLLVNAEICTSKRESRELISNNAITINGEKTDNLELVVTKELAIDNEIIIIRKGKKKYSLVKFV